MGNKPVSEKSKIIAAIAYLPPAAPFVYLWGKSDYQRFHGYQGIALMAYGVVAIIIVDIVCYIFGVSPLWWLLGITALYVCFILLFALFAYAGIKLDMKIYKSPEDV